MTITDAPDAEPSRRALLLGAAAATADEEAATTTWQPAAAAGYGEALVADALGALRACDADALVLDWPPPPPTRASAWAALEAARRRGGDLHVVLHRQGGAGRTTIEAARLADAWPDLWREAGDGVEPAAAGGPAVTVIVRSMDRPSLGVALDSVAWQTHRPLDIVVVASCGAGHRPLAPCHGNVPLRVVGSADGAPLPRPRAANAGLDAARGDLLLFLDDDDLLLPDHVAKLVAALAAAPDAAAAYGDVDHGHREAGGWVSRHVFGADFDPVRLCFENYLPIHAVLFRRRCLDAGARVDEQLPLLEDWDFWLQCAGVGPFVRAPGVSARYVAGSPDGSDVFAETPLARESRARLFAKWHARLATERYVEVMVRLQAHYRGEAFALAQLELARREAAALRGIVAARDAEIASLRTTLAAREAQAASAREYAESLRTVLRARDEELAALKQAIEALRAETPLAALRRTLHHRTHAR